MLVLVYSNQDGNAKRRNTRRYYLPKGFITIYNVIINGNHFYDLTISSNLKGYEEIRMLTLRQDVCCIIIASKIITD